MGLWYILEYQYPTEMAVADLSCLSFRFRSGVGGHIIDCPTKLICIFICSCIEDSIAVSIFVDNCG